MNKTYKIKTIADFIYAAMETNYLDGLFDDEIRKAEITIISKNE